MWNTYYWYVGLATRQMETLDGLCEASIPLLQKKKTDLLHFLHRVNELLCHNDILASMLEPALRLFLSKFRKGFRLI